MIISSVQNTPISNCGYMYLTGFLQVELVAEVMSIASCVVSNIHHCDDFREDFAELLQCPAHVIRGAVQDVEMDLQPEDLKCLTASMKLLTRVSFLLQTNNKPLSYFNKIY
jgi:hypothetical protein